MRKDFVALLLAGTALAGCGDRLRVRGETRLSFDQFVNATVALRRAAAEADNPAAYQLRKREIESKLHFSDADLKDFARANADNVPLISAAWDSVEARLDRPATPAGAAPNRGGTRALPMSSAIPGGGNAAQVRPPTPPLDDTLPTPPPPKNPPKAPQKKPFY